MKMENNNNLGVPQGSGYPLYLFCEKTKKDDTTIPHAKSITHYQCRVLTQNNYEL